MVSRADYILYSLRFGNGACRAPKLHGQRTYIVRFFHRWNHDRHVTKVLPLQSVATANANAAPQRTACGITMVNRLGTLPRRSSTLTPTGESTSITLPHCREGGISRSSVTVALCLRHLLSQNNVGIMKCHHLALDSGQLLLDD